MPHLPKTPEARGVWYNVVTPDYFQTLGIRLVAGRVFEAGDVSEARPVAVVNQALARFYFGHKDPIGREIAFMSAPGEKVAIVGIVGDVHHDSLRKAPPRMMYAPLAQAREAPSRLTFEVRTAQDPLAVASEARRVVRSLAPSALFAQVRTMKQQIDASLVRERALATLSVSFGALALLLACVGLYALVSYEVARRTREIGIRLALGATRTSVLRQVLGEAASLSAAGVLLGTLAALGAVHTVTTMLFGLPARDPVTLFSAAAALITTTCVAAFLPARRAAALDPGRVLRAE